MEIVKREAMVCQLVYVGCGFDRIGCYSALPLIKMYSGETQNHEESPKYLGQKPLAALSVGVLYEPASTAPCALSTWYFPFTRAARRCLCCCALRTKWAFQPKMILPKTPNYLYNNKQQIVLECYIIAGLMRATIRVRGIFFFQYFSDGIISDFYLVLAIYWLLLTDYC